jgi:hypothetical protein
MNWLRAGALYFLILFALGTVVGIARVAFLVPRFGPDTALLLELPVMLLAGWFICRDILRKIEVPRSLRLAMGATYFLCLLSAEAVLGRLFGSFGGTAIGYSTTIGLAAQLLTALYPRLQAGR